MKLEPKFVIVFPRPCPNNAYDDYKKAIKATFADYDITFGKTIDESTETYFVTCMTLKVKGGK